MLNFLALTYDIILSKMADCLCLSGFQVSMDMITPHMLVSKSEIFILRIYINIYICVYIYICILYMNIKQFISHLKGDYIMRHYRKCFISFAIRIDMQVDELLLR